MKTNLYLVVVDALNRKERIVVRAKDGTHAAIEVMKLRAGYTHFSVSVDELSVQTILGEGTNQES